MTISEIFDLPKTYPRWLEFVKEVPIEYTCYICKPEEGSLEEFDRYIAGDR